MALAITRNVRAHGTTVHTSGGSYSGQACSYDAGDLVLIIVALGLPNVNNANITALTGTSPLSFSQRGNYATTGGRSVRLITYWARATTSGTFTPSITHSGYVISCAITILTISGVQNWSPTPFSQTVARNGFYYNGSTLGNISASVLGATSADDLELFYFFSHSGDFTKSPVPSVTSVFNEKSPGDDYYRHCLARADGSVPSRSVSYSATGGFAYAVAWNADIINGAGAPVAKQTRPIVILTG